MGCIHSVETNVATPPPSPSKSGTATPTTTATSSSHAQVVEARRASFDENTLIKATTDIESQTRPVLKKSKSAVEQVKEIRNEEGDLKSKVVHLESIDVPFGKPIEEVYDGVHDGDILGSGFNGDVRLVTHKATGIKYAVKRLDLGQVKSESEVMQLREEIVSMCQLDHPNIVRLEEVYEGYSEIYLVQELCEGGDLYDKLDQQPDYHYSEAQCARLVKEMLSALRYLHEHGIIHRDIKLENFLFSSTSPDSELKMIDFGLSKHFKFGEVHHDAVGTPYTVAPEVIRGSYDEECDIWAIGVLAYLLLSGYSPFGGDENEKGKDLAVVRNRILHVDVCFEPEDWSGVSSDARDFIELLLRKDPKARPTAEEAQQHPWIKGCCSRSSSQNDLTLRPEVAEALVSFKEYSDIHKLLCEVLSFTLLPEQIKELRTEFEKMDTDGSGEISLRALKAVLIENASSGSLGGLMEDEVEDIFNAVRVRKTEQRIQWHEFIAACITQCHVDERNLRLAFDRVDHNHKGFITFDDFIDLVGSDGSQTEDTLRMMWSDSMKSINCRHSCITYDDFLLLMKGQGRDGSSAKTPLCPHSPLIKGLPLAPIIPENGSLSLPPLTMPSSSCKSIDNSLEPQIFGLDSRRVLLPPERERSGSDLQNVIDDDASTPLVVNRALYRAHRQMRNAVLDTCKRFEEQQAKRARETLLAQSDDGSSAATDITTGPALVMRHHSNSKDVSPEDVQRFLMQTQKKREYMIETATRRGGRRGKARKKTISDMSGMMASFGDDKSTFSTNVRMNFGSHGKGPSQRTFATIEDVFRTPETAIRQE